MYGQVEYLIVMQEGAKARLAAEGNDRVDGLSNRTAEKDVVRDHGRSS